MIEFVLSLGSWALENFWPALIWWSLPAGLIYFFIWRIQDNRPLLATRLSSGLMISLPLYFLIGFIPIAEVEMIPPAFQITLPAISISVAQPAAQVFPVVNFVSGIALVIVLGFVFVSFLRLSYKYLLWFRFKTEFRQVESGKTFDLLQKMAGELGIDRSVRLFTHDFSTSPFTFGFRRPAVVLPLTVMCQTALQKTVFAHELVHIQRYDDLLGRIEQLICVLAGWHPIVHFLNKIILLNREVACDNATLSVSKIDKQQYAHFLVNLLPTSVNEAQSLCPGMAALNSNLSRRIIAMKNIIKPENNTYLVTTLMLAMLLGFAACSDANISSLGAETTLKAEDIDYANFNQSTFDQLDQEEQERALELLFEHNMNQNSPSVSIGGRTYEYLYNSLEWYQNKYGEQPKSGTVVVSQENWPSPDSETSQYVKNDILYSEDVAGQLTEVFRFHTIHDTETGKVLSGKIEINLLGIRPIR